METFGRGSIINISYHAATNVFSSSLGADREARLAVIGQD